MKKLNSSIMRLNACVAKGYSHLKVGFVAIALGLLPVNSYAQAVKGSDGVYDIAPSKTAKSKASKKSEKFLFMARNEKGKADSLFMGPSGACYFHRVNKDGKPYRRYLKADQSEAICKQLGVEYKGKSTK